MMEGVVQRGTAAPLRVLHRTLAGKTGTTNDSKDVWFVGFSPNIAAGLYIGYDEPMSLGQKETGGGLALPVFKTFIEQAIKDQPDTPFRAPPGVQLVRIDPFTGQPPSDPMADAILEPFLPGTDPDSSQKQRFWAAASRSKTTVSDQINDGYDAPSADVGTGGIY